MDQDAQFFQLYPDRKARIRLPVKSMPYKDQQRAVRYLAESELEFRSLGPHDVSRRRILIWRCPPDHPSHPNHLLKIPFLAFQDETIEDRDDILLPIIDGIMREARGR
jgi:hypothetical protein